MTLTPPEVVRRVITRGATLMARPALVVDCGAGSGRFTIAAARRFPRARLLACESNPLLALILRTNAQVLGLSARLKVVVGDFRDCAIPAPAPGRTLFLGNPPYVRHHEIPAHWKRWYSEGLRAFGLRGSQLAGLHLHFLLRTAQLSSPGDAGCFVTAAEWLDTNYGGALRQLLLGRLGGRSLFLYSAHNRVFPDALVTGCITAFLANRRVTGISFVHEDNPRRAKLVPASSLAQSPTWSAFAYPATRRVPGATSDLGEYFRVHRGQVTGANRIWVQTPDTPELPASVLIPCITDASELTKLKGPLLSLDGLRRVVSLPADLATLSAVDRSAVDRFIDWARNQGALESYVARHRRPWWSVKLMPPPPIIMTYMGRRPPVFVRNIAGAGILNIAHGLYPVRPLGERVLNDLTDWLNSNVTALAGRTYAGGLIKFEPREAMRIPVPPIESFHDVA